MRNIFNKILYLFNPYKLAMARNELVKLKKKIYITNRAIYENDWDILSQIKTTYILQMNIDESFVFEKKKPKKPKKHTITIDVEHFFNFSPKGDCVFVEKDLESKVYNPSKLKYKIPMKRVVIDELNQIWKYFIIDGCVVYIYYGNDAIEKKRYPKNK